MRILLLLFLVAMPARSGEVVHLSVDKEMPLGDFVADMAARCGWTVLCAPGVALRQTMGACFSHDVARDQLAETLRAILAFYEVTLADAGGGVRVAVRTPSCGITCRVAGPIRSEFEVLGLHGTRLVFDCTSTRPVVTATLTLPPRTRDRLLLGLRYGLHPRGREVAARLLGAIGPRFRTTADALARALDDGDGNVRLAAVRALAQCGDAASHVLPRLRALCHADDAALRDAARAACRRLAPLSDDAR